MRVTAIIAAGGRGTRFGGGRLKQLIVVGGRPVLERSVGAFADHPGVHEVVVALPHELVADPPSYLRARSGHVRVVGGGERRQDSVANAFRATSPDSSVIVVHDAARPFASADLISRTIAAAAEHGAALAALGAWETVKQSTGPDEAGHRLVTATLPRDSIFLAQTPQAFRREVLDRALAIAGREGAEATDEAVLVERAGQSIRIVDGERTNIKITTDEDLAIAEAIAGMSARPARTSRAGIGYDLHRLVAGQPLVLGGVTVPSERGAIGHSDADVVCHALVDAILGAACLGDIGRHFPDSDPRWKGASSLDLLASAVALVAELGLQVGNVDVTVVLESPRLRDHIERMRANVARVLAVDPSRVSIKGKTNEGMDAVGRGEAVAAHAVALVRSR
jgi:2-C-methyl-D-erythritol 4-phosphate cytidylyltransferase/2-C-methyl-D-erythritol 2,4-cyclodiphosphate synthase